MSKQQCSWCNMDSTKRATFGCVHPGEVKTPAVMVFVEITEAEVVPGQDFVCSPDMDNDGSVLKTWREFAVEQWRDMNPRYFRCVTSGFPHGYHTL